MELEILPRPSLEASEDEFRAWLWIEKGEWKKVEDTKYGYW
jgi:hypothetical protein